MRFDRIRKLFALAADQSDTPEGETAARVARRLMHEHDVQLSQLSPQQREDADPFTRQTLLLGGSEQWRCRLLSVVARHGECVASWRPGAGQGSLYGRCSSVEVTEYLFVVLSRDLTRARALRRMELRELPDDAVSSALNDFCQSAVLAIEVRCAELRADEPESCTAMVQFRSRGLWNWMKSNGTELRKEPPFGYRFDEKGWQEGHRFKLVEAIRAG